MENVIGTASSRDQFLGTETQKGRALNEVMPSTILKKAESNCNQRGITMLLGLRGMTWEQLAKYGVTPDAGSLCALLVRHRRARRLGRHKKGAQGAGVGRAW